MEEGEVEQEVPHAGIPIFADSQEFCSASGGGHNVFEEVQTKCLCVCMFSCHIFLPLKCV